MSKKKVLFYCKGPSPTEAEQAAAEEIGATAYRNASKVLDGERLERADIVAGAANVIPAGYAEMKGVEVVKVTVKEPGKTKPVPSDNK